MNAEGWYCDPCRVHEARWFSDGTPTGPADVERSGEVHRPTGAADMRRRAWEAVLPASGAWPRTGRP